MTGIRPAPRQSRRVSGIAIVFAALFCLAYSPARAAPSALALAHSNPGFVIAKITKPLLTSSRSATVQLQAVGASGSRSPIFHPFSVAFAPRDLSVMDVSRDGHWLAFADPTFHVHLVSLQSGVGHVIGKGCRPLFSSDGRYLAVMSGEGYPISSPGVQGFLKVYNLKKGTFRTVGKGNNGPLYSEYSWSLRGHELAWQINLLKGGEHQKRPNPNGPLWLGYASASAPQHPTITRPPGKRGDIFIQGKGADVRSDGGFAWDSDGKSVLYWRWDSMSDGGATNRWSLTRWSLPNGTAHVVIKLDTAFQKDQSFVPQPVVSPNGKVVASLLGGAKGAFNQLKLIYIGTRMVASKSFGGVVLGARFNRTSTHVAIIREAAGRTDKSYALRLVVCDVRTLKSHAYGSAIAAYWVQT